MLVRSLPLPPARLVHELRRAAESAAASRSRRPPSLSLVIVGDRRMRRLNRQYHASDRTTDVLAFPYGDGADDGPGADAGQGVEGEVIVCAPFAAREARKRGLPWLTELLLYVVHGVLHLLGEDDHDEESARRMRRLERNSLSRIGYSLPRDHLEELKR